MKRMVSAGVLAQFAVFFASSLTLTYFGQGMLNYGPEKIVWNSLYVLWPTLITLFLLPRLWIQLWQKINGRHFRALTFSLVLAAAALALLIPGRVSLYVAAFVFGIATILTTGLSGSLTNSMGTSNFGKLWLPAAGLGVWAGVWVFSLDIVASWVFVGAVVSVALVWLDGKFFKPSIARPPLLFSQKDVELAVGCRCWMMVCGGAFIGLLPMIQQQMLRGRFVDLLWLGLFAVAGLWIGMKTAYFFLRKQTTLGWAFWACLLFVAAMTIFVMVGVGTGFWLNTIFILPTTWVGLGFLFLVFVLVFAWGISEQVFQGEEQMDSLQRYPSSPALRILSAVAPVFAIVGLWAAWYMHYRGVSAPGILLLFNALIFFLSLFFFWHVRMDVLRSLAYLVVRTFYRVQVNGAHWIPSSGGAVVACNHVGYFDPPLLVATMPRQMHFLVDAKVAALPWFAPIMAVSQVIPVATGVSNRRVLLDAFRNVNAVLASGRVIGIFPEGGITRDGHLGKIQSGLKHMLKDAPVPVVPMVIRGMWGSIWSRHPGSWWQRRWQRGLRPRVIISVGEPLAPPTEGEEFAIEKLEERFQQLLAD